MVVINTASLLFDILRQLKCKYIQVVVSCCDLLKGKVDSWYCFNLTYGNERQLRKKGL